MYFNTFNTFWLIDNFLEELQDGGYTEKTKYFAFYFWTNLLGISHHVSGLGLEPWERADIGQNCGNEQGAAYFPKNCLINTFIQSLFTESHAKHTNDGVCRKSMACKISKWHAFLEQMLSASCVPNTVSAGNTAVKRSVQKPVICHVRTRRAAGSGPLCSLYSQI